MHGSAPKNGGKSKPSFYVALQHGSRILRILARLSLPGCGFGQPLLQRVCACDAQCCREKRHVHCGLLTLASLLGGSSCRSLRCAFLKRRSFFCASMLAHCFFYTLLTNEVFGRFLHFSTHSRVH